MPPEQREEDERTLLLGPFCVYDVWSMPTKTVGVDEAKMRRRPNKHGMLHNHASTVTRPLSRTETLPKPTDAPPGTPTNYELSNALPPEASSSTFRRHATPRYAVCNCSPSLHQRTSDTLAPSECALAHGLDLRRRRQRSDCVRDPTTPRPPIIHSRAQSGLGCAMPGSSPPAGSSTRPGTGRCVCAPPLVP
jgi:hypothetical protein